MGGGAIFTLKYLLKNVLFFSVLTFNLTKIFLPTLQWEPENSRRGSQLLDSSYDFKSSNEHEARQWGINRPISFNM